MRRAPHDQQLRFSLNLVPLPPVGVAMVAPAMRAAKHAEAHGLTQSLLMQSTLRQVRQYQKSVGARGAKGATGGGGSTGSGGGHKGDGGTSEPFSM